MKILNLEFTTFHGAGEDGVECRFAGVRLKVVLDGVLAGLVLVLGLLGVAPPEKDLFVGALGADDSSAQGIVAVGDVGVVAFGFDDAVI